MTLGFFKFFNAASLCMLITLPALADPMIIAHRGGTGDTPENTLLAFRTALDNGADALWMTV